MCTPLASTTKFPASSLLTLPVTTTISFSATFRSCRASTARTFPPSSTTLTSVVLPALSVAQHSSMQISPEALSVPSATSTIEASRSMNAARPLIHGFLAPPIRPTMTIGSPFLADLRASMTPIASSGSSARRYFEPSKETGVMACPPTLAEELSPQPVKANEIDVAKAIDKTSLIELLLELEDRWVGQHWRVWHRPLVRLSSRHTVPRSPL